MNSALPPPVQHLLMQVNRDTVLQAREVIKAEVDRLQPALNSGKLLRFEPCGDDPVSGDAVVAYTERMNVLWRLCQQHIDELQSAVDELGRPALRYGYTEAEITASLRA